MNTLPFAAAACLLLGACATGPEPSSPYQLASDTRTLAVLGERLSQAHYEVRDLSEAGLAGEACARLAAQSEDLYEGAAIVVRLLESEAAIQAAPGGPAALAAADNFSGIIDEGILLEDEVCR